MIYFDTKQSGKNIAQGSAPQVAFEIVATLINFRSFNSISNEFLNKLFENEEFKNLVLKDERRNSKQKVFKEYVDRIVDIITEEFMNSIMEKEGMKLSDFTEAEQQEAKQRIIKEIFVK